MPFPQSFLDELIARNDIVDVVGSYVPLTPKGGSYLGLLPLPQRKDRLLLRARRTSRSTTASAASKGGGVINFIMEDGKPLLSRRGARFWPSGPTWRCRRKTATAGRSRLRAAGAGAEPGCRPVLLSELSSAPEGQAVPRLSGPAADPPEDRRALRHGGLAGQPGTPC